MTEAASHGVAMMCTDELNLNVKFTDKEDIVVIPYNADEIVKIIEFYVENPTQLYTLAEKGASKVKEVYGFENQIRPRIKILENQLAQK